MKRLQALIFTLVAVFLCCLAPSARADNDSGDAPASVACASPTVSVAPGSTGTITVNCLIDAPDADSNYQITGSTNNFMAPATVYLSKGLSFLTARLQAPVTSPDGTVTSISGTSSGFTARLSSSSAPKNLSFQYSVTTSSATPAGTYNAFLTPAYYRYRICTNPACNQQVFSGTATTSMSVSVASSPVSVSCASPTVNATAGGGPFSLDVVCTISGGNPGQVSPSNQNVFSPGTITLTNGASNLSATLQSTVTSPDGSVSAISGTAGGGFTASINSTPAKVQVRYSGSTTNNTPAGTYTSAPVTFAWSTI